MTPAIPSRAMVGALLYLRLTSLWNAALYRLRRLRQPKYLVGTAVAVVYFYFILLRRPGVSGSGPSPLPGMESPEATGAALVCAGASALALVRIAFAWISPADKPGLRFSEAEISFLFPAPITRRMLIHFRLLSAQLAIMLTSVLLMFFFRRFGSPGGSRLLHAAGWWVILSTFDLHLNGTNLTLARLKEQGSGYFLWRTAAVAAIVIYAAAVVWSVVAFMDTHAAPGSPAAAGGLFGGIMESAPLRWLLLPFSIVFAPYFASGAREFALAIGPALAVLGLHYYWVCSTEARFEEGSIALAERRAAARAAAMRGEAPRIGRSAPRAIRGPFPLSPTGLPEVAFMWKNLLSMRSTLLNRRAVLLSLWVLLCVSFALRPVLAGPGRGRMAGALIGMFSAIIAGYTLLVGPQIARQDLRNDLPNADMLKTYPLEGWRLALGELLAPTAVLTLILWLCIMACALGVDPQGSVMWLTPGVRLAAALSLGLVAPVLCFLQLIVPNAVMVLLPGMYQASRSRAGGIEMIGQRMILGIGQLIIAMLVGAPAAGAGALVIFSSHWLIGLAPAIVLAALAVLAILGSEAVLGLWWLGARFEKFDLSAEAR